MPLQIYSANGPAPNTVNSSKLTTVRSAPAHLLSACAYTIHIFVAQLSPCAAPNTRSGRPRKFVTAAGWWMAGLNGCEVKKQL